MTKQKKFETPGSWAQYETLWLENYEAANYGKTLSGRILKNTHSIIEADTRLAAHYDTVLELGVGTMAHFSAVRHGFSRYIASDHDAKVIDWLKARNWDARIDIQHLTGSSLPFPDNSVDRVIATHVLEHLPSPVAVLEEWVRVVRPGGVVSLILPCDPGLAWRFGRMLGPRRTARKAGLPYDYYMAVEHVNAIFNLRSIIAHHFPDRSERWWPLRIPVPDVNLIYGVNCYL
ncbi:MAG TPA: class I SAM-dependent methyltransferase [Paracoccaceae bacterium]|nr:class I SAM-dependent methyltransferase [Paracoccaceae bacterium]HMO70042.1 class I SAM-dependent methyltransferase [Paracoccaceae bacterium]